MKSTYAHGRASFPAPAITVENSGTIQGGGNTYYFWIKGRNRVGCNAASAPLSLTIPNNKKLLISSTTFAVFNYEDWRYIYLYVNTTNNFNTSHIVYTQALYEDDQVTPVTLSNVEINSDYALNGVTEVAAVVDVAALVVPNGYRLKVTATNKVYEFNTTSTEVVDNLTVLTGTSGVWLLVNSNTLAETNTNASKEIYQVTNEEFIAAPLPSVLQDTVPLKYYILNNAGTGLESGELNLNNYISDSSLGCTFDVEILGYLDLDDYSLDTTGIEYVNTVVSYPETKIRLSKTLPANSVLVIKITPNVSLISGIIKGTFVSLYPKLNSYTTIDSLAYAGEPVADLAELKALPLVALINYQSRYVVTKQQDYVYDPDNTDSDDGDTVLLPNFNPASGRWIVKSSSVPGESITLNKLADEVITAFTASIKTTTIVISTSQTYVIDLDTSVFDYYIIKTPIDDGNSTIINFTGTLSNNNTKAIVIELRQNTGTVEFHSSILFPGGNIPVLSGNGKNDIFILSLNKDNISTSKKRGFMVQKDVG